VCVCEKEKKNVKGEKMGSFEKLWGDNPLGPKKKKIFICAKRALLA
jgi:hypothetical protein